MFKKRTKKEAVEVAFTQEESREEIKETDQKETKDSSILLQSRGIKKVKNRSEQNEGGQSRIQESMAKNSKQGLEDITGLIDKKYLKETFDEEGEQNGENNENLNQIIINIINQKQERSFKEDLDLRDQQNEDDEENQITDIEKDRANEIEKIIKNQLQVSQNQQRFQFQISTKPTINTQAPGFSEVRFSFDQKAKSLAQIEEARMKKLFGCDLFSSDFEKSTQQKMSKEAIKEKQEREFRQFEDRFLKRGRKYLRCFLLKSDHKQNQMRAKEYNSYIDSLN